MPGALEGTRVIDFGQYIAGSDSEVYAADAICVLTLAGSEIEEITAFRMPELFARFGLPGTLSD